MSLNAEKVIGRGEIERFENEIAFDDQLLLNCPVTSRSEIINTRTQNAVFTSQTTPKNDEL